ncbi:MAG: FGGY family carbohydrate kinase [Candidatus Humimicrobiaceae bacterium]
MGYLLGMDIGSGGCKATLLEIDKGAITQSAEYSTYYPHPGWAEQDSADWIDKLGRLVKEVMQQKGCLPEEIEAIGIGGVTHSPVLLERSGEVIGRVIHITDRRSYRQAERLKEFHNIEDIALNSVDSMWTMPMIAWVHDNQKYKLDKTDKILFPKDYVRFRLTGSRVTDYIDAQGTLFFDPAKKQWNKDLVDLVNLDMKLLPEVASPAEIVGKVTKEGSSWSGLAEGTPVIAGSTDTALEVFAAGSINPGDCTVKMATFGRICVITDKPFWGKGFVNYSYVKPELWYPGTGTRSFATSLKWFRDEFCRDLKGGNIFIKMDSLASKTKPGADGLIFHPYLQGEGTPYDDPYLRGNFLGLSLHHKRPHLIRAVLEGTAMSLRDSLEFIKEEGINISKPIRLIGGGSKSKLWSKIVADVTGLDAVVPAATDASFGAAMLAGVGIGVYSSVEDAQKRNYREEKQIKCEKENTGLYDRLFSLYKYSQKLCEKLYHFKGFIDF